MIVSAVKFVAVSGARVHTSGVPSVSIEAFHLHEPFRTIVNS